MKQIFVLLLTSLFAMTAVETNAKKKPSNKVIAHRGAWKNTGAPQNSIAALNEAIKLKCFGSEFDVRMTKDGQPVVNHDPSLGGIDVDKNDWSVVKNIKLSNGESIPTLEDYLLAGKNQKTTRLVLEIKSSINGKEETLKLTRKCVELVKKHKMQKIVDYIAFDYDACKLVAQLDPKANIAYLNGDVAPAELVKFGINGIDYNLNTLKKKPEWIKESHANKLTVNVWTVNKEEDMKHFLNENVDVITTDEPELLFKILKQ